MSSTKKDMRQSFKVRQEAKNNLRRSAAIGSEKRSSVGRKWAESAKARFESGLAPVTLPALRFLEGGE